MIIVKTKQEKLYYLQDTRGYVGNSMLWWKQDNCGYVCDIREAKVFTKAQLKTRRLSISAKDDNKRAWPKDYIDKRISYHIDIQACNFAQALNQKDK